LKLSGKNDEGVSFSELLTVFANAIDSETTINHQKLMYKTNGLSNMTASGF